MALPRSDRKQPSLDFFAQLITQALLARGRESVVFDRRACTLRIDGGREVSLQNPYIEYLVARDPNRDEIVAHYAAVLPESAEGRAAQGPAIAAAAAAAPPPLPPPPPASPELATEPAIAAAAVVAEPATEPAIEPEAQAANRSFFTRLFRR
jgi:hypothetical protein